MQRWIKLPDGRCIDANRIAYVGKTETFAHIDENGTDMGTAYSVNIGTGIERESQLTVIGTREDVLAVLKAVFGRSEAPPTA